VLKDNRNKHSFTSIVDIERFATLIEKYLNVSAGTVTEFFVSQPSQCVGHAGMNKRAKVIKFALGANILLQLAFWLIWLFETSDRD